MRVAAALLVLLALGGCSDGGAETARGSIVASFYPLAWAVERVAPGADVVNLTPPGVEPHDVELTPSDVRSIRDARLVVYLSGGFQPAVEDAVQKRKGLAVDVRGAAPDPHVWLDPLTFAGVVERIARALGRLGAARVTVSDLRRLDADYRRGLRRCDRRVLVTTHAAFGQLARRYGLTQLSLAGRSPESEPGPRELERLIDAVESSGATTVFAEPLLSQRIIRAVGREANVDVATLDPIEGLSATRLADGEDYLSVMRENLAALRKALGCR